MTVNMVKMEEKQIIVYVNNVRTLMKKIFEILVQIDFFFLTVSPKLGMQSHSSDSAKQCIYHQEIARYSFEKCVDFRVEVQRLMTLRVLVIERPREREVKKDMCMIRNDDNMALKLITL